MKILKTLAALSLVVLSVTTCTARKIPGKFVVETSGYCAEKCAEALRKAIWDAGGKSCTLQRLGDSPTKARSWLTVVCGKEAHIDKATLAIALSDEAKLQGVPFPRVEQEHDVQAFRAPPVPYGVDQADGLTDGASCPRKFNKLGWGTNVWVIDSGCTPSRGGVCAAFFDGVQSDTCGDVNGHGSHVGGTATDAVFGVAPGATRHCIRILNSDGNGVNADLIRALLYAQSRTKGNDIINLSLGGDRDVMVDNVVRDLADSGIYFAIASGNNDRDSCLASPPGAAYGGYPRVFSVAAHDKQFVAGSFSNAGDCTTISAPGVDVESTIGGGLSGLLSGTSMACPHVAGAMAVLLSNDIVPSLESLTASTPAGAEKISFTFNTTLGSATTQHPFLAYACKRS